MCVCLCILFFFKQKTAYEMRISDWSSDVCSSDLIGEAIALKLARSGASVAVVDICHDDPDAPSRKLPSWDELQAVAERVTAAGGTGLAIKADLDRMSTRLNSSHQCATRMPTSA